MIKQFFPSLFSSDVSDMEGTQKLLSILYNTKGHKDI